MNLQLHLWKSQMHFSINTIIYHELTVAFMEITGRSINTGSLVVTLSVLRTITGLISISTSTITWTCRPISPWMIFWWNPHWARYYWSDECLGRLDCCRGHVSSIEIYWCICTTSWHVKSEQGRCGDIIVQMSSYVTCI